MPFHLRSRAGLRRAALWILLSLGVPLALTGLLLHRDLKDHRAQVEAAVRTRGTAFARDLDHRLGLYRRLVLAAARIQGPDDAQTRKALAVLTPMADAPLELLRLLDAQGRERLRFQWHPGLQQLVEVPPDRTQNRQAKDYFQGAAALPAGASHVGRTEVHHEDGRPALPVRPFLRLSAPARDASGRLTGVVVANLALDATLLLGPDAARWWIVDEAGEFLVHPDPAWRFGRSAPQGPGPTRDFAALTGLSLDRLARTRGLAPAASGMLFHTRLDLGEGRHWTLVHPIPPAEWSRLSPSLLVSLALVWTVFLAGGFLFWRADQRQREKEGRDSQERLLRAVMQAATGIGIIATDAQGTIQLFNTGAEQLLGYRAEDVIRRATPALFHLDTELEARAAELADALGEPVSGFRVFSALPSRGLNETRAWTYRHADGHLVPVSLAVSALRDRRGRIFGYLGVAQNIQVQRARETDLEARAKAAQESALLKSAFLANLSHEIRTPMNAIMAMTRYLLTTDLDQEQKEITEIGRKAAGNLLELLDRILDLSKVEAGHMTLEVSPFSPIGLTRDCAELWRADATAKGLAFLVALPQDVMPVLGDPLRLKQVLNNLLGNALKFTAQGGITLRLQAEEDPEGTTLAWSVEDTGIGMDPAAVQDLFRPFTQAQGGTARKYGGTGLGLALCHELVRLMDGHIRVDTRPGQGTTFTVEVWLPKAPS